MKNWFALLCLWVARRLAPELHIAPDSYEALRLRHDILRKQLSECSDLKSARADWLIHQMHDVTRLLKNIDKWAAEYAPRVVYEEVKVNVAFNESEIAATNECSRVFNDCHNADEAVRIVAKRRLFNAVAAGFAESREIDKFIYFRDLGGVKCIGIRLYLKHEDGGRWTDPQVGNYTNDLRRDVGNYADNIPRRDPDKMQTIVNEILKERGYKRMPRNRDKVAAIIDEAKNRYTNG